MNLNFPIEGDNRAGIKIFYFAPVEHVASETDDNVKLKSGKIWNIGKAVKLTPNFSERSRRGKFGNKYTISLEGSIAKRTEELDDVLEYMVGRDYVVVYQDLNGNMKIAGSVDQPLTFEMSARTGRRPGNNTGVDFIFSGTTTAPTRYFKGSIVSNEGSEIDPEPNLPVTVKWNEDIIAVATSGQTVLIVSEFAASEIKII